MLIRLIQALTGGQKSDEATGQNPGAFQPRQCARGVILPRPRRLACLPPSFGSVAFPMPLGLITRRFFSPFNRSDLIALRSHDTLQMRQLAEQFHNKSFQLGAWQPKADRQTGHTSQNRIPSRRGKPPNQRPAGLLLRLPPIGTRRGLGCHEVWHARICRGERGDEARMI
jgi:hypothetical protein